MGKKSKTTNDLSKDELITKIGELRAQLFKLKLQKGTGQLENTSLIKNARKELARVKTFITQKSQG